MIDGAFIFIAALLIIIKGATMATRYATRLAESFHLSKYAVGFIIVAVISVLPEAFIAINSAIGGVSSFGLGMLFGASVTDLTLIFAIIVLFAQRGLKVESKILKNHVVYPFLLFLPLVLGMDGYFSRLDGVALIIAGMVFYYIALRNGTSGGATPAHEHSRYANFSMLLFSMALLLVGAYFIVASATTLATLLGIQPILIGVLIVGLGTTMPELFFSLESVKKRADSLAIGDILGTVLANATVVVGILASVSPFSFPVKIIYVTGAFMVVASLVLFHCMRTGRALTRREAFMLIAFWIVFVLVEFIANT